MRSWLLSLRHDQAVRRIVWRIFGSRLFSSILVVWRLPAAGRFRRPFSSQETKPGQLNLHCNTLGKRFPRDCWEFEHVQITKARVFRIHLCDQFQVHLWAQWKRLGGGEERQKKNSFSMKSIFSKRHCSDAALLRIEYNSRHFWL